MLSWIEQGKKKKRERERGSWKTMLSVKNDNTKILQMKCKITFYEKKKKKKQDRKKKKHNRIWGHAFVFFY